jgi:hypothetical protein
MLNSGLSSLNPMLAAHVAVTPSRILPPGATQAGSFRWHWRPPRRPAVQLATQLCALFSAARAEPPGSERHHQRPDYHRGKADIKALNHIFHWKVLMA